MSDNPLMVLPSLGGDFAEVEVFGHRRHFGRITEVERFGAKFLHIEVIGTKDALPIEQIEYAGTAIFSMRPLSEHKARMAAECDRPQTYGLLADQSQPEDSFFDPEIAEAVGLGDNEFEGNYGTEEPV